MARHNNHNFPLYLLILLSLALPILSTPLPSLQSESQSQSQWVDIWTTMPQLTEPANLPPAPFVCSPSPSSILYTPLTQPESLIEKELHPLHLPQHHPPPNPPPHPTSPNHPSPSLQRLREYRPPHHLRSHLRPSQQHPRQRIHHPRYHNPVILRRRRLDPRPNRESHRLGPNHPPQTSGDDTDSGPVFGERAERNRYYISPGKSDDVVDGVWGFSWCG